MPLPQPIIGNPEEDGPTDELASDLRDDVDFSAGVLLDSASQIMKAAGIQASDAEAARLAARLLDARATEIETISRTLAKRKPKGLTANPDILVAELDRLQHGDITNPANKKRRSEIRERLRGGTK